MEGHSSTLESYKIGGTIQLGSFWKVKVATNNLTGQKVAVKVIKRDDDTMKSIGMEEKGAHNTCMLHAESLVYIGNVSGGNHNLHENPCKPQQKLSKFTKKNHTCE